MIDLSDVLEKFDERKSCLMHAYHREDGNLIAVAAFEDVYPFAGVDDVDGVDGVDVEFLRRHVGHQDN